MTIDPGGLILLPKQLTVAQVAEYFQRDEKTIRRWITEGKFPHAYKVSDGWFIPEGDIKRLIKKMHQESIAEMPGIRKVNPVKPAAGKGFVSGWK